MRNARGDVDGISVDHLACHAVHRRLPAPTALIPNGLLLPGGMDAPHALSTAHCAMVTDAGTFQCRRDASAASITSGGHPEMPHGGGRRQIDQRTGRQRIVCLAARIDAPARRRHFHHERLISLDRERRPTSGSPVTGTGACGLGSLSFSSDWMTNTSPGALTELRPTDVKMGGAIRPISSVLNTVRDGTRAKFTSFLWRADTSCTRHDGLGIRAPCRR